MNEEKPARIVAVPSDKGGILQELEPHGIDRIFDDPVEVMLTNSERLTLFTLIVGLQPDRVLEIGTWQGGSAGVIVRAMDSVNRGYLISLDPADLVPDEHLETIKHRAKLVRGASPEALEAARNAAQSAFDFVFIDAYHSKDTVIRDTVGVLSYLSREAHLLYHDAHHPGVHTGINECLARFPGQLQDCGLIDKTVCFVDSDEGEQPMCGLRLVVYRRAGF